MATSIKLQQVSKMLQKTLAEIFYKEKYTLAGGAMVSISEVKLSPDMGVAKVYLSFMLNKNPDILLETIQKNVKEIRKLLGSRIKDKLRIVPNLVFHIDEAAVNATKINRLLDELDITKNQE